MDSETNILVRQLLAGLLFVLGIPWAVCAAAFSHDVFSGILTRIGPMVFWLCGSLIWISWGAVAFTKLRRRSELASWIAAAFFHAAVWGLMLAKGAGRSWSFDGMAIIIPLWWLFALLVSVAGVALTVKNQEQRV